MNDDPQLIIFEPLKTPRTVVLNVKEDSDTDSATIFDEDGRTVTDYNVLYDEPHSATSKIDQEKIISYIENWESQNSGNVITDKQARKIEKRKRIQAAKIRKKERNKERKAAMKSLIHCAFDRTALTNTKDVAEERAILQAMKMQNHSIKNVLNVKKNRNRFINLNTNYRPLENSTIELGLRKTPIDVVVLDSDEEAESDDDDIQINIDPLPRTQRRNRVTDFSNDNVFPAGNNFQTSAGSNARKRRNKTVEVVQIVDSSSDSDVECVSNPPSVESLSDDDDDQPPCDNSTAKKTRLDGPATSDSSKPAAAEEEVTPEISSMVDNFVGKYIQHVFPIIPELATPMDTEEPATPQIVITESISLQPNPSSSPKKSKQSTNIVSEDQITRASPSSSSKKSKKKRNKHVAFNNAAEDSAVNDDDLVIVEHEPDESIEIDSVDESVQTDPVEPVDVDGDAEKTQSVSDDSIELKVVSEDEADEGELSRSRSPSLVDFDSIPSPDYSPFENIPATASNIKAFVDFIKSRRGQEDESDEEEKSSPKVRRKSTPPVKKGTQGPTKQIQASPNRTPTASKQRSHPWQKRDWEKSDEIVEVNEHPISHHHQQQQQQPPKPWQNRSDDDNSCDIVEVEHVESRKPWQNRRNDKSDEIQVIESPPTNRKQCEASPEKSVVPEINRSDEFSQVDSDKRGKNVRNSSPEQRPPPQSTQKIETLVRQRECRHPPCCSSNQRRCPNRRTAPQSSTLKMNSAVEFFDKNSIRIGQSGNKPENVCCNEKPPAAVQQRPVEPVNSTRKFYPKQVLQCEPDDESRNDKEQLRTSNSQRTPPNQKPFCERENRQCGAPVKRYDGEESWKYESGSETALGLASHDEEEPWRYESGSDTAASTKRQKEKEERWRYESGSKTPTKTERQEDEERWRYESGSETPVKTVRSEENEERRRYESGPKTPAKTERKETEKSWRYESGSNTPATTPRREEEERWRYESEPETPAKTVRSEEKEERKRYESRSETPAKTSRQEEEKHWRYESGSKTPPNTSRHEEEERWRYESEPDTPAKSERHDAEERWRYESGSESAVSTQSSRPPKEKEPWQKEPERKASVDSVSRDKKIPWQHKPEPKAPVDSAPREKPIPWRQQQQQQHEPEPKAPVDGASRDRKIPWQQRDEPKPETRVDNVEKKKCRCSESEDEPRPQQQKYVEPIRDQSRPSHAPPPVERNRYKPEPYEESKYHPPDRVRSDDRYRTSNRPYDRNRYHPEPYEEDKYVPGGFRPQHEHRRMSWGDRGQNRGPYRDDRHHHHNRPYRNDPPTRYYDSDNFNQGRNFQPRFEPNQGQRFHRNPPHQPSYRHDTQNTTRYNQQPETERQRYWNNDQRPSSAGENNQFQSQSQPQPFPSSSSSSQQPCAAHDEEVLFTRRDKFQYKANVSDFDDIKSNNQRQQPRLGSVIRDRNGNIRQASDVEHYESNVARNLRSSSASNSNEFSWNNNKSCDYVSFNADESPPWVHDYSDPDNGADNINALSRRVYIKDAINSKRY